jgi:signal transduction histidine kinase
VLIDQGSTAIDRTVQIGRNVGLTDVVATIMHRRPSLVVTDEIERQEGSFYRALQGSGISAVVSLETSKDLIGYILYGYKANGRIYSNDDVNLVKITADELAVAVQNALRFEEIARFNETLQKEVDQATAELRESNKKLKSLDQAKDEFISMASHQLRTPLTSVKGYMSMVLEGDAGDLNRTQKQLLEQAFASSQRMAYLISDFLNVSRLQTGKFIIERRPVDLAAVVQEEAKQLQSTAESRGLKIEVNVPSNFPTLSLDESKLRQAIMNFMDNAIFYSRPGGVIKVDLVKTVKELVLTVQDQGIGVPPSERHHLFTKFYRASNARTARPDGTGIGLFMAKKVVVAHGGSIVFSTVEDKGSTFGFRLPLAQPTGSTEHETKKLK